MINANDHAAAISTSFNPVAIDNSSVASTVTMESLLSRQQQTESMLTQYGKTMDQILGILQSKEKDDKPPPSKTDKAGGPNKDSGMPS